MNREQGTSLRHWIITFCALGLLIALGYMGGDQLDDQLISESVLTEIKNSGSTEILDRQGEMVALATPTANAEAAR